MGAETKQCPFCAEDIKAAAVKCRFCGSSLEGTGSSRITREAEPPRAPEPVKVKVQQHGMFMRMIKGGIALMTFAILASIVGTCVVCGKAAHDVAKESRQRSEADRNAVTSAAAIDVSSGQLEDVYETNEVSADNQYRGKVLRVTGDVGRIDKDILDDPHVILRSAQSIGGVTCSFGNSNPAGLADLRPGQRVTLRGIGDGYLLGSPMLRACIVDSDQSPKNSNSEAPPGGASRPTAGGSTTTQSPATATRHQSSRSPQKDKAGLAVTDEAGESASEASPAELTESDRALEWRGDALTPPARSSASDGRSLDDGEIQSVVSTQATGAQHCVVQAAGDADLKGTVTVKMVVDGAGNVTAAKIRAAHFLFEHGLLDCMQRAVRQMKFPATGAASLVTVPINLS